MKKLEKQPGSKKRANQWKKPNGHSKKPWSKLQREIYNLIDENLDLQIHCSVYRMDSARGSSDMPRYFVTLGYGDEQEILFDYPKQFMNGYGSTHYYPYGGGHMESVSDISLLIREYIDTPKDELMTKTFEEDKWGLSEILRCSDRRIGKRTKDGVLVLLQTSGITTAVKDACTKILEKRFEDK